ncbi:MAG: HD domain-containing protein [Candidatus Margulisbacteria bacterium]|jgi:hypothetical protein|nr:HD domain-containing protein [Candidatus Margulisiibacteriota bacterium]
MGAFWSRFTALLRSIFWNKLKDADIAFLRDYLNKQEQILFYSLAARDQRHSLDVAYTVRDLLGKRTKINPDKLYKAALLHDVGKAPARLRISDRIVQVLFFTLLPPLADYLADHGSETTGYWRRILFFYKYHPRLGAALVKGISGNEVLYLIEHHHDAYWPGEPKELTIIREADSLN